MLADEVRQRNNNAKYYKMPMPDKQSYKAEKLKTTLAKENVTQAEVDAAKSKTTRSRCTNGANTDKTKLQIIR